MASDNPFQDHHVLTVDDALKAKVKNVLGINFDTHAFNRLNLPINADIAARLGLTNHLSAHEQTGVNDFVRNRLNPILDMVASGALPKSAGVAQVESLMLNLRFAIAEGQVRLTGTAEESLEYNRRFFEGFDDFSNTHRDNITKMRAEILSLTNGTKRVNDASRMVGVISVEYDEHDMRALQELFKKGELGELSNEQLNGIVTLAKSRNFKLETFESFRLEASARFTKRILAGGASGAVFIATGVLAYGIIQEYAKENTGGDLALAAKQQGFEIRVEDIVAGIGLSVIEGASPFGLLRQALNIFGNLDDVIGLAHLYAKRFPDQAFANYLEDSATKLENSAAFSAYRKSQDFVTDFFKTLISQFATDKSVPQLVGATNGRIAMIKVLKNPLRPMAEEQVPKLFLVSSWKTPGWQSKSISPMAWT